MKLKITLRHRKKIRQIVTLIAVVLLLVYLGFTCSGVAPLTGIKLKGETKYVPSKTYVETKFPAKSDATQSKETIRSLKMVYEALKETGSFGDSDTSAKGLTFDEWKENKATGMGLDEARENFWATGLLNDMDDATFGDFYSIIQKKNGDISERYHLLSLSKQKEIQKLKWKSNKECIYAVNQKGKYIDGTAQMNIADSDLITNLEKAGFQGIQAWMKKAQESKLGFSLKVNGKNVVFHDTDKYETFSSHGVRFYYNHAVFFFEMDINSTLSINAAQAEISNERGGNWTIDSYSPGGAYKQIQMATDPSDDYTNVYLKIMKQGNSISQMTMLFAENKNIGTGKTFSGFYEKEIPYLKECLIDMGVDKASAEKWLKSFSQNSKQTKGKIGSCSYEIKHEVDLTYGDSVCKVIIKQKR